MEHSVGDVVVLKSGGPKMVIEKIGDAYIECVWFSDQKVEHDKFVSETLVKKEGVV
ncbi:hypothetical protein FACS1894109_20170 [Spirochaetia bacterium]|nr:hypothetical protein FACS1894109_20170 [Spirochaetia bacterium]